MKDKKSEVTNNNTIPLEINDDKLLTKKQTEMVTNKIEKEVADVEQSVLPDIIKIKNSINLTNSPPPPSTTTVPVAIKKEIKGDESIVNSELIVEKNILPPTAVATETIDTPQTDVPTTVDSNETTVDENKTEATPEIVKLLLDYAEGQWSPSNPDGKKYYLPDQLLRLRDDPKSRKKPENLPDCEVSLKQIRSQLRNDVGGGAGGNAYNYQKSYSTGGNSGNNSGNNGSENPLLPNFARNANNSQRGQYPKRISQQGNQKQNGQSGNSGGKGSNSRMIHVTLSLREDIKLNENANAWKPTHLTDEDKSNEEKATDELLKRVRGILNKLTPEKFNTLVSQLRTLNIDSPRKLGGIIELIFEKAVDEPNFASAYAQMCFSLSALSVNVEPNSAEVEIFKKKLLTHCQNEFEKISKDEKADARLKELDQCKDPEKRQELEEEERKFRRRSVGIVRFIGELFKFNMLTQKIISKCIKHLLSCDQEESLECLCKLLTTVGQMMEKTNFDFAPYISQMQDLVNMKKLKISSRVRFMLQDVIDLKKTKWVPRRTDLNPKTMGQIQKEAETEQMNIQLMNYYPSNRKDDRGGGVNSGGVRGGNNNNQNQNNSGNLHYKGSNSNSGRNVNEEGWSTQSSKNNRTAYPSNIDPNKLNPKTLVSVINYLIVLISCHINVISIYSIYSKLIVTRN